ncbi:MAG TPA: DUF4258 domain-containing protein [bacterium]|nr:DUF4258 domain-containing protein [bacterium]
MSHTLARIIDLVRREEVRVSDHGYEELSADGIFFRDLVDEIEKARLIEDYPDYPKGPCVLVLEKDRDGSPVHAVWGIPRNADGPAVLVTAYRPDPAKWGEGFTRRKK